LKDGYSTYEEKFLDVEADIKPNIERHDCFYGIFDDDDDMINNIYADSDEEVDDYTADEFGMLNPDLIDHDMEDEQGPRTSSVPSTIVENISLSREEFHEKCSQLNEGQLQLLNYIMKHTQQLVLNSRNDLPEPEPFHILLSGGAGVGKSFLVHCITAYELKTLKYPAQDFRKEPSIKVTASTGKAATNVNGTTLHSAFGLPVHQPGFKTSRKPSDKKLDTLRDTYKYLKTVLIDEISMIDKDTFDNLNVWLRMIKRRDDFDFGGVSMLLIGDFFQLPPTNQNYIFRNMTLTDSWHNFCIHELTEIVRQSNDPEFAELLNRLREGNQTEQDIAEIKSLEQSDESEWPRDHVRLFMTNDLKNKHDDSCMKRLLEEDSNRVMHAFYAKDSKQDTRTGSHKVSVSPDLPITKTGNLPYCLKVCIGNTVMLTYNKDQSDNLINGSKGTVVYINSSVRNGIATGTIYVKFESPDAGRTHKNSRLRGELKECVPIHAHTNKFRYGGNDLWVERKQFPLVLAHALTIHKSQGDSLDYLTGDMDRTTKTGRGKTPVNSGQFYTLLSRARTRDKVKLKNFDKSVIKVSDLVKAEMARMRKDCVFSWKHPLLQMTGTNVCLLNIVSWNLHLGHFLSDETYQQHSAVLCFTETYTNESSPVRIEDFNPCWKTIHHPTSAHGLAICFNTDIVVVEKQYDPISDIEMLPLLLRLDQSLVLLILVYRPPNSPRNVFIDQLKLQMSLIKEVGRYRTIVLGDFNTDQMLPENVNAYQSFCQQHNFTQRSKYSTHIQGGILDLVFDNEANEPVEWMPSPYSDHFVLLIGI
jgi:ATP-dependent DNA helicase PIF1